MKSEIKQKAKSTSNYLMILLFVVSGLYCHAQNSRMVNDQIPFINIATNPQSFMMFYILYLHNDKVSESVQNEHELKELQKILVDKDLPYLVAQSNDFKHIVFKPGLVRRQLDFMQVLHHDEENNYFLLCPKVVENICGCGTYLYYYLPESNELKSVQKPFSFSLKRNLAKLLNRKFDINFDDTQYDSTCDLLKLLTSNN